MTADAATISGTATGVIDGADADLLIVAADAPHGPTLFTVDGPIAGLRRDPLVSIDLDRPMAELVLAGVPARPLGTVGGATPVLAALADVAQLALAAEQAGGARRCLGDAVAHATVRYQFGRPIGSFQAIKHACAEMYQRARSGHVAVRHAADRLDRGAADAGSAVALATTYCSDAYVACAQTNLQVHGGMGFTTEVDCHRHYRRARGSAALFGTPAQHRQRLADLLLPDGRSVPAC